MMIQCYYGHILHQEVVYVVKMKSRTVKMKMWVMMAPDKGGIAWKISKCVNGRLTYMHLKQAIKILLPWEYISHSRQKRHWASKYLPGIDPLTPNHDIFKYCHVALKVVQKGKKKFQIGRLWSPGQRYSYQLENKFKHHC